MTERDWRHLWLSEGFASYFDLVFAAALGDDSALARGMRSEARGYLSSNVVDRALVDAAAEDLMGLLNANSYNKGAWVLHLLRGEVGDSAFFRGIRRYYATFRDSSVLSEDFERVMERAAGRDLRWFFRQWLYQPGYPRLDVTWRTDAAGRRVTLHVRQAQSAAWGRFRLPRVAVRFTAAGGAVDERDHRPRPRSRGRGVHLHAPSRAGGTRRGPGGPAAADGGGTEGPLTAQQIRIQSFVAAGRAEVWDALLHRTDVVLDALPEPRWPEGGTLEVPARLTAPWPHTAPLGAATEVVVDLAEVGSGTLLDLRHRGLGEGPAWDEAIGGYFAAWLQALAALGVLVESGVDARPAEALRGRERYVASGEIPAPADPTWRSLTDRYVLERWSDGALDGRGDPRGAGLGGSSASGLRAIRGGAPAAATGADGDPAAYAAGDARGAGRVRRSGRGASRPRAGPPMFRRLARSSARPPRCAWRACRPALYEQLHHIAATGSDGLRVHDAREVDVLIPRRRRVPGRQGAYPRRVLPQQRLCAAGKQGGTDLRQPPRAIAERQGAVAQPLRGRLGCNPSADCHAMRVTRVTRKAALQGLAKAASLSHSVAVPVCANRGALTRVIATAALKDCWWTANLVERVLALITRPTSAPSADAILEVVGQHSGCRSPI